MFAPKKGENVDSCQAKSEMKRKTTIKWQTNHQSLEYLYFLLICSFDRWISEVFHKLE